MTAAPLSADEQATQARFDAAPTLPEVVLRPFLDLAAELDEEAETRWPQFAEAAARIRSTVATVLAADPEPHDR